MFYVTGTSKQDLFNTAEKTKESIVDDVGNCDFKTLSISPPDTSPDSFHEVPVDCPEEVPVDVPENKTHAKQGHVQVRLLRMRMGKRESNIQTIEGLSAGLHCTVCGLRPTIKFCPV